MSEQRRMVGTIDAFDVAKTQAERDALEAMVLVLLPEHPGPLHSPAKNALEYLRGLAAIGESQTPEQMAEDEEARAFHGLVMATLKVVGAEPLSPEELEVQMLAATEMMRKAAAREVDRVQ